MTQHAPITVRTLRAILPEVEVPWDAARELRNGDAAKAILRVTKGVRQGASASFIGGGYLVLDGLSRFGREVPRWMWPIAHWCLCALICGFGISLLLQGRRSLRGARTMEALALEVAATAARPSDASGAEPSAQRGTGA